tara:strand:+ start:65732 stop:66643 length:912 start_codon:yes stop_codon:yes gene_type:complete
MKDYSDYNEFDAVSEIVAELELAQVTRHLERVSCTNISGEIISAIKWGTAEPEVVFLHGAGQNAHSWDATALVLARSAIAIDLPGHGHSSWREDQDYSPHQNAEILADVIAQFAPAAQIIVGMSLGGSTAVRIAALRPELVRKICLVDVTPGARKAAQTMAAASRGSVALIAGPRNYPSFDAMADAAIGVNPKRAPAATRRGVRHNARQLANGSWTWRYDRLDQGNPARAVQFDELWEDVSKIKAPLMLVRGGKSKFVTDEDEREMRRRQPGIRVEVVAQAGHSVQNYAPHALAALIDDFLLN